MVTLLHDLPPTDYTIHCHNDAHLLQTLRLNFRVCFRGIALRVLDNEAFER